jgi:hypothetical protein
MQHALPVGPRDSPPPAGSLAPFGGENVVIPRLMEHVKPTLERSAKTVHPAADKLVQEHAADSYARSFGAGFAEYSDNDLAHVWKEDQRRSSTGELYHLAPAMLTRATAYQDDDHRRHDMRTGALYWLAGRIFRHMFHQVHFGPISNVAELCHALEFFLWSFHFPEAPVFTSFDKQHGLRLLFSAGNWLHIACDKEVGAPYYTVEETEVVAQAMLKWYSHFHDGWCGTLPPLDTEVGASHAYQQGAAFRQRLQPALGATGGRAAPRIESATDPSHQHTAIATPAGTHILPLRGPHAAGAQAGANTHGDNTHHT